jgi:hypothetical protein
VPIETGSPSARAARLRRLLPLLAGLAAALHAATFWGYGPCDDDFIVYRYARNLVEGHGLVFNPPERVEGFSSPGWVLTIAAALGLGLDPAAFSAAVSVAACGLAAWAVGELWNRGAPERVSAAPGWLAAASPAIGWHSVVGLGTVPLAAALALWLRAWERALRAERVPWAAAALLGSACFLRAEAVLFALPFIALEARRGHARAAAICLVPLAAWQAFRVAYYGRWVPVTYSVKKLTFAADLELGLAYAAESTLSTGILGIAALALVALLARPPARAPIRAAAAGLLAHLAYVIYVGGDFFPLARFFVPVLPLGFAVACEAAEPLLGRRLAPAAWLVALALLQAPQWRREVLLETHRLSEPRWALMGREVRRRVPPDTAVALAPIGAFGYESRLPIVDTLGLTNTSILEAEPDPEITIKGHQRYDADWVLGERPEMIILGNGWLQDEAGGKPTLVVSHWEGTLVRHPRFQAEYQPLWLPMEASYPLLFYWRRGVPWPLGATSEAPESAAGEL